MFNSFILRIQHVVIIAILSMMVGRAYAAEKYCNHCQATAHKSKDEKCTQCDRWLKDCPFPHMVDTLLTAEDVVNARDINVLMDHLFTLRNMYKEENGRNISLHDLFKKVQTVFQKHDIALSNNGLRKIKEVAKRRDLFEIYCAKFLKDYSCDEFATILKNQNLARQINSSDEIDVDYPLTLQYGILIV